MALCVHDSANQVETPLKADGVKDIAGDKQEVFEALGGGGLELLQPYCPLTLHRDGDGCNPVARQMNMMYKLSGHVSID